MAKRLVSIIILLLLLFNLTALNPQALAADAASKAGAVTISEGWLNVRRRASSGAPIVSTLKKGSYITLISKSGSWWRVEYAKDCYGYCHADYIAIVQGSPATVAVSSGSLNVRNGPSTSYSRTASLNKGTTVLLLTNSNGWSRVLYYGTKTGYVSARYLSGGAGQTPESTYPAVFLPVPSYKQTDSRWANVTIGSSGKTIAKIGCATKAIAMIESYRTGTNIHPDAMSKKLRYTSGGASTGLRITPPLPAAAAIWQKYTNSCGRASLCFLGQRTATAGSTGWS